MSLGALQDEASLQRWLDQRLEALGLMPNSPLPFKNVKFGTATISFAASPFSAQITVEHGLGATPTGYDATSDAWSINVGVEEVTDTVIKLRGGHIVEAVTEEHEISWWVAV